MVRNLLLREPGQTTGFAHPQCEVVSERTQQDDLASWPYGALAQSKRCLICMNRQLGAAEECQSRLFERVTPSMPFPFRFCLGDSQDQSVAGSTAGATKIARVPAGSLDRHARRSGSGDHGGRDRGLHLLTAGGQSV